MIELEVDENYEKTLPEKIQLIRAFWREQTAEENKQKEMRT